MLLIPSALFAAMALLLPFSLSMVARQQRHNLPPVKRQFEQLMPWTVGPEQICTKGGKGGDGGQQQQCNIHNHRFQCACPLAESEQQQGLHSCRPRVEQPGEQLLTIGIAFPLLEQFREDPERVFLEDLEIFTFIPREAIVIYKRGCSRDESAYEFQIGILESTCRHSPIKLRTIHPRIFLSNPFFMHENALKIAYIRAAAAVTP